MLPHQGEALGIIDQRRKVDQVRCAHGDKRSCKGGELPSRFYHPGIFPPRPSFLPLSTADPFGGVIITDWYSPPESPEERFKVTVYILDRELRADGLRVSVFRQTRAPSAGWIEAKVDDRTGRDLENAILKRARQMRIRGGQG